MEMAGVTLCGPEAQGPGGSWEGTEGWSFLMGEKRGQLALTVTSCPGGLLVTISLWTFNIAQIPLHMWHFCFCHVLLRQHMFLSVSLSLRGSGLGFGHSPAVKGSDAHLEVALRVWHWVLTEHL